MKDGKKVLVEESFLDEHNLSRVLLMKIDGLLKKSGLEAAEAGKMEVVSDQGDAYTTTRIAKTVAKSWNWGVTTKNLTRIK